MTETIKETKEKDIKPPGWNMSKDFFETVAKMNEELVRFRQELDVVEYLKCFDTLVGSTAPFIWKTQEEVGYKLFQKRLKEAGALVWASDMSVVERQEKLTLVFDDLKLWHDEYYFLLHKYGLLVPIKEKIDREHSP